MRADTDKQTFRFYATAVLRYLVLESIESDVNSGAVCHNYEWCLCVYVSYALLLLRVHIAYRRPRGEPRDAARRAICVARATA
jgi:hypothetical protein